MDVQPENSNSVEAAWEFQMRAAADWDERSRNSTTTWVPPILAALVDRARRSSLNRFFPFTSHAVLRFSTAPNHWLGAGAVLPVTVALAPEGLYIVRAGADGTVLETADADEAVTAAERLVGEWHNGQLSNQAASEPFDGGQP
ncbi:DUF6193 family natural product biosynthesis protein [Streptomyces sp. NRRL B-24484]|uniref:DUF6193 family natural product biosynthesis protein n=1 Tax=Streptomyces sp. NRRL B-24484 TaxID=1463833 RepID=UPI0004BFF625|nr:DUF6193 family natural product biosynthesis protein [Streptomyces sp. NRRL B-24484]